MALIERRVIGFFGATGTGKTQAARVTARDFRRRLYLDVREDYEPGDEGSGADAEHLALSRDSLSSYLSDVTPEKSFSAIYRPPTDEPEFESAAFLCEHAWVLRDTLVVIDEAHRSCPQHEIHPHVLTAVLRGRKRGISLFFVSQRPAHVHTDVQSECFSNEVFLFRLRRRPDLANLVTEVGNELADAVAGLERLHGFKVSDEGIEDFKIEFDDGGLPRLVAV